MAIAEGAELTGVMFFQFESDFVESLRCIPMQVRLKLDTCGVKLKLQHWHQFAEAERHACVALPCATPAEVQVYRDRLQALVTEKTGQPAKELAIDPAPPWARAIVPTQVREQAQAFAVQIADEQWARLTDLQRFALVKLSRPGHENQNFYPALQEFGLTGGPTSAVGSA